MVFRELKHENVFKFWGSALLSSDSDEQLVGVAFEWHGYKTLAREIFDSSSFSCSDELERFATIQAFSKQLLEALIYLHARKKILMALNPNDVMVLAQVVQIK